MYTMVSKQQQQMRKDQRYQKLMQKVADENNLVEIIVENDGTFGSNTTAKQKFCPEKIIKTFSEIMKNLNKMRVCTRPTMCKPYGKQSESLQRTLNDTIQLVRSLRTFLPPPHIAVGSWKSEDKHRSRKKCLDNHNKTVLAMELKDICDAMPSNSSNRKNSKLE